MSFSCDLPKVIEMPNPEAPDNLWRKVSIREQACLLPPLCIGGVAIYIIDESSRMHTNSFKALTAVECIADCCRQDVSEICCASGANTGMALAAYGARAGIRTHVFMPTANTWKLDGRHVGHDLCTVYGVDEPAMVKSLCDEFGRRTSMPITPTRAQRLRADHRRGALLILLMNEGLKVDWFAQAVSAGFGPIGIYDYVRRDGTTGLRHPVPRLLAVQQAANCVLAEHLRSRHPEVVIESADPDGGLIVDTMYDRHPETYGTFPAMERLLLDTQGAMVTVSQKEFMREFMDDEAGKIVSAHLRSCGVKLVPVPDSSGQPRFRDNAGLLAIAGVVKAARSGRILPGEVVLCSFSGGASSEDFEPLPETRIQRLPAGGVSAMDALIQSVRDRRCLE